MPKRKTTAEPTAESKLMDKATELIVDYIFGIHAFWNLTPVSSSVAHSPIDF
jgi:hypothetical protein